MLSLLLVRISSSYIFTRTSTVPAGVTRVNNFVFERSKRSQNTKPLRMIGFIPSEEEIAKQLERANELLIKSQAKMDGKKQGSAIIDSEESSLSGKRKMVTKNTTNDGLIIADGEMMAKLSENEKWEARPLMEVFEDQMNDDLFIEEGLFFASTNTTKKLAERDEVGSIRNLQVLMNMQEFKKIIDDMYYFIG